VRRGSEWRIGHLDMDAFFAAVEQLDRPQLRGRPVIVGGLGPRGVVSTASYEARVFGIASAMPMSRARQLCPQAAFVEPRFSRYKEVSEVVRSVLRACSPVVEPVSLDEAFFDLTDRAATFLEAEKLVSGVKRRVEAETRLTCSVGLAPNRFLAKLASEMAKPAGLFVITPARIRELLDPLPVERLSGVGPVTTRRLRGMGVHTVEDLLRLPLAALQREFGHQGRTLHRLARGDDDSAIVSTRESRSVSREVTFPQDVADPDRWEEVIRDLAADVAAQLRREQLVAHCVRIKVRFPDFRTQTRQLSLGIGIDSAHLLGAMAIDLLRHKVHTGSDGLRLLGVGAARLTHASARQLPLFETLSRGGDAGTCRG